jgi:hypothetical protein
LQLALVYPVTAIFLIWSISGHVGPAESALDFGPNVPDWKRGAFIALYAFGIFAVWRGKEPYTWKHAAWISFFSLTIFISATTFAVFTIICLYFAIGTIIYFDAVSGVGIIAISGLLGINIAVTVAINLPLVVRHHIRALYPVLGSIIAVALALAFLSAVVATAFLLRTTGARHRLYPLFLSFSTLGMILVCLSMAKSLSALETWDEDGPVLLFLGLLTLINAPFDWASLGLTRALLRRGLELGGWWPYLLAVVDAILAGAIIALLAITMLLGVQTFDHLAEHYGDMPVLPLDELFDGLMVNPSLPEFWWLYALLLSTMIPSLINLMIGGASLLRGVPGVPAILLRFMPVGKAVPEFDRAWIALVLTCQVFLGALLGIVAQAFLAVGVIFYILPWVGLGLLETAREVADFDLPGRVLAVLWGGS